MSVLVRSGGVAVLFSVFMAGTGFGQNLVFGDTMLIFPLNRITKPGTTLVRFRFTQEMDYSFTCTNMLFANWQQDPGVGQVALLHHLNYRSKFSNERNFLASGILVHDLGMQFYFDSISRYYPDANSFETKIELRIRKSFQFIFSSKISTRIFNGYDYFTDISGNQRRTLQSAFLTPLVLTASAGIGWKNPWFASVSLGLTGAKLTYIKNRQIYSELNIVEYYGVPVQKVFCLEYGFTLQVVIDRQLSRMIRWNCEVNLFKNVTRPADFSLKNLFTVKISKFLKGSVQTRILYDEEVSARLQFENLVSFGFAVKL